MLPLRTSLAATLVVALGGRDLVFGIAAVDGVADARTAACWDPAQVSADEDGDGVVDGCDVCPGAADPAQSDRDLDGVGDVCDPHPEPRDHLALFDGFNLDVGRWFSQVGPSAWRIGVRHRDRPQLR